jgi:hypothetical protein
VSGIDNNAFFVSKEDGTLTIPSRGQDGKYHVDCDLRVASKDQSASLMRILRPLLDAEPEIPKIVITLSPHYAFEQHRCCNNPEHCTNSGPDLIKAVKSGLAVMKKTIRSIIFIEKVVGVRMLDPGFCFDVGDTGSYANSVHLTQDRYRDLERSQRCWPDWTWRTTPRTNPWASCRTYGFESCQHLPRADLDPQWAAAPQLQPQGAGRLVEEVAEAALAPTQGGRDSPSSGK